VDADGMVVGDVAMLAEAIIRKTCRELGIEVIDIAVNPDHVHLIIK
jgi:putative transposase